jgi:aminoglycoside phosphotransferase (APT) family kinase protein
MSSTEELVDVRPQHRFDEAALASHLASRLPEQFSGALRVRQFEGGQSNPTFLLEVGDRRFVLRKKPPGKLLPMAHMVDREYRVMKALEGSAVPVPKMLWLEEDESIIGTSFFVMEYVRGRVFPDPSFLGVEPGERRALFNEMARVLAELHRVDHRACGLEDFGKPGNYFARQIGRWTKQYEASKTDPVQAMDRLIEWLPRNIPEDDTTTIAHGDYRPHNILFHPTEPRVVAVLDWELATLGHPMADVAYNCIPYHVGNLSQLARDAGSGVPTEDEYVAEYCRMAGRNRIDGWSCYIAFSLFRLASIGQGVYKRGLDGNAASARALTARDSVVQLAEAAWRSISA